MRFSIFRIAFIAVFLGVLTKPSIGSVEPSCEENLSRSFISRTLSFYKNPQKNSPQDLTWIPSVLIEANEAARFYSENYLLGSFTDPVLYAESKKVRKQVPLSLQKISDFFNKTSLTYEELWEVYTDYLNLTSLNQCFRRGNMNGENIPLFTRDDIKLKLFILYPAARNLPIRYFNDLSPYPISFIEIKVPQLQKFVYDGEETSSSEEIAQHDLVHAVEAESLFLNEEHIPYFSKELFQEWVERKIKARVAFYTSFRSFVSKATPDQRLILDLLWFYAFHEQAPYFSYSKKGLKEFTNVFEKDFLPGLFRRLKNKKDFGESKKYQKITRKDLRDALLELKKFLKK